MLGDFVQQGGPVNRIEGVFDVYFEEDVCFTVVEESPGGVDGGLAAAFTAKAELDGLEQVFECLRHPAAGQFSC